MLPGGSSTFDDPPSFESAMMYKYSNRLLQVEGEDVADQAEERDTMVHALREEPGSYTITLEDGTEVTYAIRPTDTGFIAE